MKPHPSRCCQVRSRSDSHLLGAGTAGQGLAAAEGADTLFRPPLASSARWAADASGSRAQSMSWGMRGLPRIRGGQGTLCAARDRASTSGPPSRVRSAAARTTCAPRLITLPAASFDPRRSPKSPHIDIKMLGDLDLIHSAAARAPASAAPLSGAPAANGGMPPGSPNHLSRFR